MGVGMVRAAVAIWAAALVGPAFEQGLVRGAQEGAARGEMVAGPLGAVFGGAIGAAVGTANGIHRRVVGQFEL